MKRCVRTLTPTGIALPLRLSPDAVRDALLEHPLTRAARIVPANRHRLRRCLNRSRSPCRRRIRRVQLDHHREVDLVRVRARERLRLAAIDVLRQARLPEAFAELEAGIAERLERRVH